MQTHQTQIMRETTTELRLYKTYQRGFSVVMPDHPVHVKNTRDPSEIKDPYSLQKVLGLPNNIHEYTLDKLLSHEIVDSFNQKPSQEDFSGKVLVKWFSTYCNAHLPCYFH